MGGNLVNACSTATPIVFSVFKALSSATVQQAVLFWTDYIRSIVVLSAFFSAVALYYLNKILVILPTKLYGIEIGYVLGIFFLAMVVYLVNDYIHPSDSFRIVYPALDATVAATETARGTVAYDPNFPNLVAIVEDNFDALPKRYRITDMPQIDGVGTWSAKIDARHLKSNIATLHFGLASDSMRDQIFKSGDFNPITPRDLSKLPDWPPGHCHISVNVSVTPQAPGLPAD